MLRSRLTVAALLVTAVATAQEVSVCAAIGEQKIAVILVTYAGAPEPSISPAEVRERVFGPGPSINGFWQEASYGKTYATGEVYGWYHLTSAYSCDTIQQAAVNAADSAVDLTGFRRILIVASDPGGCGFAGTGAGCGPLSSPRHGTFTASTSILLWKQSATSFSTPYTITWLGAHELGHSLGLAHERSRRFVGQPLGPPGSAGDIATQGDPFSAMGSSGLLYVGHYSAKLKRALGWLDDQAIQVVEQSGAYQVQPLETPGGIKALKIRRSPSRNDWLWVEYRQPIGDYDTLAVDQGVDGIDVPEGYGGALIHFEDSFTGPTETNLLDFTPGSHTGSFVDMADAALAAGQEWTDPYSNLAVRVAGATPQSLSVVVTYGSDSPAIEPAFQVVSAASFLQGPAAPESIVSLLGQNFSTIEASNQTSNLPTNLAGTSVTVEDAQGAVRDAPLFYVSPSQINLLIPPGTATGTAIVTVSGSNGYVQSADFPVEPVAPAIFMLNADGLAAAIVSRYAPGQTDPAVEAVFQLNTAGQVVASPIDLGAEGDQTYVAFFGTGLRGRSAGQTVTVEYDAADRTMTVSASYAGAQGMFAGLDQVNALLPQPLKGAGDIRIKIVVDGIETNITHLTLQ